jgi:Cu/Ag efflux protein CusF
MKSRRIRWQFRLGLALSALSLVLTMLGSCGSSGPVAGEDASNEKSAAGSVERYQLRGRVVQLEPENQAAVIEHDEIVGWMDAMTMTFPVPDKADWEKLSVGTQIHATVFVSDDGFHVGEIEVIQPDGPPGSEQP